MVFGNKKSIFLVFAFNAIIIAGTLFAYKQLGRPGDNDSAAAGPGQYAADPSLKYVAVLFRHGNRAPVTSYKTDPYANYFLEGKGELTKQGKQNMYKKGQIFRFLYNGYLSNLYLDSEILTKTTNIRRTFMSAAMVLAGMYPPKDYQKWSDKETVWQPIPIYHSSPDQGLLFSKHGLCPAFDVISKQILSSNNNQNLTQPILIYLSEKCGQPITMENLTKLYDLFVCQISAGLKLPEWITPDQFNTMKSISLNRELLDMFFGNLKLQKVIIGPLLKEIALNMELCSNNSNNNTTQKMHLYSGHDISIAMIMGFLGNFIGIPDFGASLHFHLYFDETIGYNVKLFFYEQWNTTKGEELLIRICGNPCKFQNFLNIMTYHFSRRWEEECQIMEN